MVDRSSGRVARTAELNLYKLDPVNVAALALERVLRRLDRVFVPALAPHLLSIPAVPAMVAATESRLGRQIQELTEYAQRGHGRDVFARAATHRVALETITMVVEALWDPLGQPLEGASTLETLDDSTLRESEDPVDLVMLAAWTRIQIARGEAVTLRMMASLAGVLPRRMQALATDGEIPFIGAAKYRKVPAKDASRWLDGRGIAGFSRS